MILELPLVFDPVKFIGLNWTIAQCLLADGTIVIVEDRDNREDFLGKIDWSKVDFETTLNTGSNLLPGEEKLRLLKKLGSILLGGRAFLSLWIDWQTKKENSVLEIFRKTRNITRIDFFGLVLRDPYGVRCTLCLYYERHEDGRGLWKWYCQSMNRRSGAEDYSATLDKF